MNAKTLDQVITELQAVREKHPKKVLLCWGWDTGDIIVGDLDYKTVERVYTNESN